MANLKNITDLPMAASAEGLNLIVNDNGAAKQIAASAVCGVKSVNGAQPDANGNVEIEIPEGFSGSWNDLKDKPFYSDMEVVLEKQVIEGFVEDEVLFLAAHPCELNISLGDKLSVWFDGKNYECTTINPPDTPAEILGFGNPAFMGGPEGPEPFFIVYIGPEKIMQIGTLNPNTSHEIGISKEVVHTIQPKYIKDMYYSETEDKFFLNETTLDGFVEVTDSYLPYVKTNTPLNCSIELEVGKEYIVKWDGIEYVALNEATDGPNALSVYSVNPSPFIMWISGVEIWDVFARDAGESHTFAIYERKEIVHKLDAKYLPPAYDFVAVVNNNWTVKSAVGDYNTIYNKLINGEFIDAKVNRYYWSGEDESTNYFDAVRTYTEFEIEFSNFNNTPCIHFNFVEEDGSSYYVTLCNDNTVAYWCSD